MRSFEAEASVVLGGSPDRVFDLFVDDANFFALRPNAVEHRDIVPLPDGGHSCVQVHEIRGRRIELRSTCRVFDRPHRIVDVGETTFGSSLHTATFEPIDDRTVVRLHITTSRNHDIGIITAVLERARTRRALRRVLGTLDHLTAAEADAERDSVSGPSDDR